MSGHLLVISLGPVQDFIAAARRTRDLWFGSFLLSDISRAAAIKIVELTGNHENLIFPAPESEDKLRCRLFNVANVILAQLPNGIDPKEAASQAKDAAEECWREYAQDAFDEAKELIEETVWNDQLKDVIEFYAAWVPFGQEDNYKDKRQQLMRLLAGRKACRNFEPAMGRSGIPKSSLDGARESVLVRESGAAATRKKRRNILRKHHALNQRLRLSRGEELDVIGVTKRAATKEPFPSVVRVAADPWIRGIDKDDGEAKLILSKIDSICRNDTIEKGEVASHSTGSGKKCYENSLYQHDGSTLFINRIDSMLRAAQKDKEDSYAFEALLNDREKDSLKTIRSHLKTLKDQGYGEPDPYLAILAADGDQMGNIISHIEDIKTHRRFSSNLAQFTHEAEKIVKGHDGCLIYAGGDDVLAFVPVDQCVACARDLHNKFEKITNQENLISAATLSIGIAIGHCLESLEDLLAFARGAEKAAKQPDRDGLAVHLYSRSGAPIKVRGRWDSGLDSTLEKWANMHLDNTLPDKAAFDLRTLAKEYAGWPNSNTTNEAIKADIGRLFSRKGGGSGKLDVDNCLRELNRCLSEIPDNVAKSEEHKDYHPAAMRLAEEWLIARRLARAMKQARGKGTQVTEGAA